MRKVLLTLALLGVAAGAWADPADLSGGVFVAHHTATIPWCVDPPTGGWCAQYATAPISDLSQVVATVPFNAAHTWYVLAAWENEAKTWCGTEFGFGAYDETAYTYYSFAACYPPTGGLEIPTPGWPGATEGTAFVTTGDPWSGNWKAVYFFAGAAYDYYSPQVIQITTDPPTGFCGFSNCMNPPASYTVPPISRGALGLGVPGVVPQFVGEIRGACCIPVEPWCIDNLTEPECMLAGGTAWYPDLLCSQVTCPQMWACCVGGICTMMFQANCDLVSGTWMQGVTCDPNPCPAVCCIPPCPYTCAIMLEADCLAIAGAEWHPEWVSCDPNPCTGLTPTENKSWGQIKNLYR